MSCASCKTDKISEPGPPPAATTMQLENYVSEQPEETSGTYVGEVSDFVNGQMKSLAFGEQSVLVSRIGNNFYATSTKCTHVGAPLERGVLNGDRIVCPWHGACFNVRTGDIEEGMVLEPLKVFRVHIREGKIYVSEGGRRLAIIGGGASAAAAIQALRRNGYEGSIDLFSDEMMLPYDRTKISKILQRGAFLRNQDFYDKNNVTLRLGCKVTCFDAKDKCVTLENGNKYYFDTFLLATGGIARGLRLGEDKYKNVQTVRNAVDADRLKAALTTSTRLVIIGCGILGLEMASAAKTQGKVENITLIDSGRPQVPELRGLFGPKVFDTIMHLHEKNGISFVRGPITRFIPSQDGSSAAAVEVDHGHRPNVEGDYFVISIGIIPATDYIRNCPLQDDGSVLVDEHCNVIGCKEVYASGDITSMNDASGLQPKLVVHHWGWAMQQGRVAAQNICGIPTRFHCIPVFWTVQFGVNFRFCGTAISLKLGSVKHSMFEILLSMFLPGSQEKSKMQAVVVGTDEKFEVYYVHEGKILGVASLNSDPTVAASAELLRRKEMITVDELKSGISPQSRLQKLQE